MTKQDFLEFKGKVTELLPNAMFRVKLENDHEIIAHTAGKLKKNRNKRLECLAIKCNEILSKNYEIIFFAGGSIITLISESIEVVMNDLGTSWNVKYVPKHKI